MSKKGCEAVGRAVVGLVRKEDVLSPIYFESYPSKPASPIKEVFYQEIQMGNMNQSLVSFILNVTSIKPWADILCGELMDRIRE